MSRNVGVIGLGVMGLGVARSLLRAGFAVHACDVRSQVLETFASEGGMACASPAELGSKCEVVVTLVPCRLADSSVTVTPGVGSPPLSATRPDTVPVGF